VVGIGVVAVLAIVFLRRGGGQADLGPVPKQNVLLVTIDTLRADALGSYGGVAATPALDRLARDGVRFDFAHAHAVLTLPSHASILTGAYPFQHGIRDNSGYRLAAGARTAATLLKQAGYRTAAFVAAFPLHSRFGLNQGFDVYDDRFGETRAPTEFVMPERSATTMVALAREWIKERAGGAGGAGAPSTQHLAPSTQHPWFLWLHVFDPHAPYRPPKPFDTQYARAYDGEVAATDAALAPLFDDVRASGEATLVVVTGDHGEALGDHGEQTHGLFTYEATLRVPLIIAELGGRSIGASGAASGGEVSRVAARHVDILPTVLDAIGQPIPADLPGRTLLPAAERRASAPPRSSYFESMTAMLNRGWAPLAGVLADRDKYIDLPIVERYELAADAAEATNLAGRSPDRDRTLAASLRAFNAPLPGRRQAEDPDAAARLRSLGYLATSAPAKARYTVGDDPKTLVAIDQEMHRAVELYVAKRYGDAIDAYRGIIARRPDMAVAYRHLAFVAWETGQVRAAIDVLQRAVAGGVSSGGVVTQLGTYLAESGSAAAAIPLLEPLAGVAAPDLDALNGLGIAYARAGREDAARQVFERMLAIDARNAMALVNLGTLDLERGRLPSARAQFERATEVDPTSSTARAGLGVVALKSGDPQRAIAAWRKAYELDATNYDALFNLGTTLASTGDMAAARPYLEQFARSAPPAFYAKDIRDVRRLLQ
jgi:arylsulfatase A-like enzyme/Flp pilus assembly protein TadD